MESDHGPRRALVTGASSGIGEATARMLAARGDRVALLARRRGRLEDLARELPVSPAGRHLVLECDVGDDASLARAFALLGREFGGLELAVNNAGIGYRAWASELEAAHVARVLATNVQGPLMVASRALPLLQRGERPVLVNVASTVGFRGMPSMSAYSASKAALRSIGESLRLEWAPYGIAVATLDPGVTATEIFERQHNPGRLHDPDPAEADRPERVARAILALAADPRPELCLRTKWKYLGALACLAPGLADRLLASRSWMPRPPPPSQGGPS